MRESGIDAERASALLPLPDLPEDSCQDLIEPRKVTHLVAKTLVPGLLKFPGSFCAPKTRLPPVFCPECFAYLFQRYILDADAKPKVEKVTRLFPVIQHVQLVGQDLFESHDLHLPRTVRQVGVREVEIAIPCREGGAIANVHVHMDSASFPPNPRTGSSPLGVSGFRSSIPYQSCLLRSPARYEGR